MEKPSLHQLLDTVASLYVLLNASELGIPRKDRKKEMLDNNSGMKSYVLVLLKIQGKTFYSNLAYINLFD